MTEEEKALLEKATVEGSFVMYRDRPLVREGNMLVYGNISDEYILQLIIMMEKEYQGTAVPDKVIVQVVKTEKGLSDSDRIVKQSLASGLYEAFNVGITWLERYIGA